jgi:NAD(P)-dependent dehydrogenase (short-subunit alcohol dehydrogenase family)
VTGGTRGVGAAVVEALCDAGARVIAAVARSVMQQLGGIDVLVNVLGGSSAPSGGFAALGDTEWSKELDQNLMSAVRLDRALLPSISRRARASSFT